MWLQRFSNYLIRHRWQTILLTFVSTFIPIIGIFGILIAAFVTLRKGIVEGAILTIAATLPYFLSFYISSNHEATVPLVVWAAIGVAVLSNVLTWVFAVMLRKEASWSVVLQVAALAGVLVVSVIHLINPHIADWWGSQLQYYYSTAQALAGGMLKSQTNAIAAPAISDMQVQAINTTKQYATGLMAAGILFNAILQLMVARWWQAVVSKPGSLRNELHRIRLSQLAGLLFVVSLILSYLGNMVVLDIMPIVYLLFGAAGLSLIHYLFGLMKSPTVWFWLSLFYVGFVLSMPVSIVLIAIFALLDIWFDFRKRLRKV